MANQKHIKQLNYVGLSTDVNNKGISTHLTVEGLTNPKETIDLLVYDPNRDDKASLATKLALSILQSSRQGIANLVSDLGVSTAAFNQGLQSRMFSIINVWSQHRHSDGYAKWILSELGKLDNIKSGDSGVKSDSTAFSSLIILTAAQNLGINVGNKKVGGTMSLEAFDSLKSDSNLVALSAEAAKSLDVVSNAIIKSTIDKDLIINDDLSMEIYNHPAYLGSDWEGVLEYIKVTVPKAESDIKKAYVALKTLLTKIGESIDVLPSSKESAVIDTTAFYMIRAHIIKSVQIGSLNNNQAFDGDKNDSKKASSMGLNAMATIAWNKSMGDDLVSVLNDMQNFTFTYRAIIESISKLDDLSYSSTSLSQMLSFYTSTLAGVKDLSSENDVISLVKVFKQSRHWNNSLAALLYGLSSTVVSDEKIMSSEEYTKLLSMMSGLLTENSFFKIDHASHMSKLSFNAAENIGVDFGHLFEITQKQIGYSDIFADYKKDDSISSITELADLVSAVLLDPKSSPLFSELYRLIAMRTVMSEAVRLRISAGSGPMIMSPFSFHEEAKMKVLPLLSSISYAVMAELGVYYMTSNLVKRIALETISYQISLFESLKNVSDDSNIARHFDIQQSEEQIIKMKEVVQSATAKLQAVFDASGVGNDTNSLDALNNLSDLDSVYGAEMSNSIFDDLVISHKDDLIIDINNGNTNDISIQTAKVFSKNAVRSARGIIYNAVKTYVDTPILDVTVLSTNTPDSLADSLKLMCMKVIATDAAETKFTKRTDTSVDDRIYEIKKTLVSRLKLEVHEHAMAKMITISLDMRRLISSGISKKDVIGDSNSVLIMNAMKDIIALNRTSNFSLAGDTSRLQRQAYAKIKPSLLRLATAIKPSWRHVGSTFSQVTTEEIPFYDRQQLAINCLSRLGIDPNTSVTQVEYSILTDLIGKGSAFSMKTVTYSGPSEKKILLDVLIMDSEVVKAAGLNRHATISFYPVDVISDIFTDRVVIKTSDNSSKLLISDKITGAIFPSDDEDNMEITLMITAAEYDDIQRQFVTKEALLTRMLDDTIIPMVKNFWL
jgi:hypothetical protein